MSTIRMNRLLCAADPAGSADDVQRAVDAAKRSQVDGIAVVGDLSGGGDDAAASYRAVFKKLGESGLPAYWVPGPSDAPVVDYLRESHNIEVVFPMLRGVHGTAALAGAHFLFAGMGGEVDDDPQADRDETQRLRYPRWEAEYRLKIVREFEELRLAFLTATPPAHKGKDHPGSEALTELVHTYRPVLVVCGGDAGTEVLGNSLVVAPGSIRDGHYAVADLNAKEAQLERLAAA